MPRSFSVGLPRHFVPRNDNEQGDSSVGYFACAQYDVLFIYVILNEVKNPTEELTGIYTFSLKSWDISLALNMTCLFYTSF